MGAESMALGSLITAASGLIGICISKCKCSYRREDGDCQPGCAFQDKPIFDEKHELEISHHTLDDIPVLLITKKTNIKVKW